MVRGDVGRLTISRGIATFGRGSMFADAASPTSEVAEPLGARADQLTEPTNWNNTDATHMPASADIHRPPEDIRAAMTRRTSSAAVSWSGCILWRVGPSRRSGKGLGHPG